MHEMFQHAAAEGQKEAEQIVCQGCWQKLPQLTLEVGISAIQLVGPETSKEELQELYLEVYKLHRLPGSPSGEPVLLEEVLSSLEDHQGQRGERASAATVRPHPEDPHPLRSGASQKEKWTAWWRGVWPPYVRPTKSTGHASYPQRRNRKIKLHPELPRSEGKIQEQGPLGM